MAKSISSEDNNIIKRFGNIFENKCKETNESNELKEEDLKELAGRVTRGSTESDFEYLQKDRSAKKFAWVMGNDGLILFLKQSDLEALRSIGFEDRWIRKKLENGEHLRLGIFYRSDNCFPGTWDGIFTLIDKYYSKDISTKIFRYAQQLKQTTFDQIEARARLSYLQGASYFDVNEAAFDGYSTDPRFMSEETFSQCQGTLEECRGFLYNRLGLTRLFDGNGFTKHSDGQLYVREYLQFNGLVKHLPGFQYFDLNINIDDLMPDA